MTIENTCGLEFVDREITEEEVIGKHLSGDLAHLKEAIDALANMSDKFRADKFNIIIEPSSKDSCAKYCSLEFIKTRIDAFLSECAERIATEHNDAIADAEADAMHEPSLSIGARSSLNQAA